MMSKLQIVTIGVYGSDAEHFFGALQSAEVDTVVDIRQRRGVRGSQYAFVNSQRLQARLAELGIRYLHRKDLAPTKEIRERQHAADKASGQAKRKRTTLGETFKTAYRDEILAPFEPQSLLNDLPNDARVVALFCVEREPQACHRSLLAETLAKTLPVNISHLIPDSS